MYKSLDDFLDKQNELVELEWNEEVEERKRLTETRSVKELEQKGVCVRNLQIRQQKTGMYGRYVITFGISVEKMKSMSLNSHKLSSGDIVGVYLNKQDSKTEPLTSGIISYTKSDSITVAFDEEFDTNFPMYRLILLTNDVTHRRLKSTLKSLEKICTSSPSHNLIEMLFPCEKVETPFESTGKPIHYFNPNLDESQQHAVESVLMTRNLVSVIHGPPGTGKTTTVIEVIRQAVKMYNSKLLVCAPSNIAVDNLVERLAQTNLKIVRLGHPARTMKELKKYTLDAILTNQDSSDIIKNVRSDIFSSVGKFKKCKNKSEIFALRREVKDLKKELVEREKKLMTEVLTKADVILSTTTSASREGPLKNLPSGHFDLAIIDEAAQALEISCWIPLLHVPRCILAGDHQQLPPTIISDKAARQGLSVTLLERVVKDCGDNVVAMLTTQYRMNEAIMKWPSEQLYHNKLIAADSIKGHLLKDLDDVESNESTNAPLVFVDTAGCDMFELATTETSSSKGNEHEVDIIKEHVITLVNSGVKPLLIGIITPYNQQVELLRQSIRESYPQIEINSVDGFQGREKEAILISMVRSNDKGGIGFLSEDRRINVAITRARRHLFVVGDSFTISKHPFLNSLCNYLNEHAVIKLAKSYTLEASVTNVVPSSFELPESFQNKNFVTELKKSDNRTKVECSNSEKNNVAKNNKYSESRDVTKISAKSSITTDKSNNKEESKTDDEDTTNLNENFEEIISNFVRSDKFFYYFPTTLSSKDRALVHSISENYNITHDSQGDAQHRRIVLSKTTTHVQKNQKKSDTQCNSKESSSTTESMKTNAKDVVNSQRDCSSVGNADNGTTIVACEKCSVNVPNKNYQLHLLRCKGPPNKPNATPVVTKKKKKKKMDEKENKDEEDFDSLVQTFAKENTLCRHEKCKASIKLLGQKCQFCSQMFCLSHHMPEIHGCGRDIRVKARQDIAKYGTNIPKKMNNIKKVQVHKKLDKKLTELEDNRKKKSKK